MGKGYNSIHYWDPILQVWPFWGPFHPWHLSLEEDHHVVVVSTATACLVARWPGGEFDEKSTLQGGPPTSYKSGYNLGCPPSQ